MLKQGMLALVATLALASGAHAQDVTAYSTPDSATVKVTHDGDVDTTTCSSSIGGVYCRSYTTTVEAELIGQAEEKMLPADSYKEGGGSISALKVLPEALKDAMRESCDGRGFWKQLRDPDCKPMAQIEATMELSQCLGSHDLPSGGGYACSSLYDRAYQQYLINLKRGNDSRGYPVIYRLRPKDDVLWEFAPVFLPLQLLSGRGTEDFDALKDCLARFENASTMRQNDRCVSLYNRAVDAFNNTHRGVLSYTKVVPNYRPKSVGDCQAQTQEVSELMECFRQFDNGSSSLPPTGGDAALPSAARVDSNSEG